MFKLEESLESTTDLSKENSPPSSISSPINASSLMEKVLLVNQSPSEDFNSLNKLFQSVEESDLESFPKLLLNKTFKRILITAQSDKAMPDKPEDSN